MEESSRRRHRLVAEKGGDEGKTIRVFSNLHNYASPSWAKSVRIFKPKEIGWGFFNYILPASVRKFLSVVYEARQFYRHAVGHDVAVVTGSGSGIIFGIMQAIFRKRHKVVPVIYLDCLYYAYTSKPKELWKRWQLQMAARPRNLFVCWSSRETTNYADHFRIPKKHFRFIPYFNTLEKEEKYSIEGDYIFSGGNSDRDYPTLIKAIDGFPLKVVIATQDRRWITPEIEKMGNVVIRAMPYKEYTKHMKECMMNVLVLKRGLLRSAGQQTFINSMYLGKPTIICDNGEANDYIVRAVDAIHVSSGNHEDLRAAILALYYDPALRSKLATNAKNNAQRFSHENTMKSVLDLGLELAIPTKDAYSGTISEV